MGDKFEVMAKCGDWCPGYIFTQIGIFPPPQKSDPLSTAGSGSSAASGPPVLAVGCFGDTRPSGAVCFPLMSLLVLSNTSSSHFPEAALGFSSPDVVCDPKVTPSLSCGSVAVIKSHMAGWLYLLSPPSLSHSNSAFPFCILTYTTLRVSPLTIDIFIDRSVKQMGTRTFNIWTCSFPTESKH